MPHILKDMQLDVSIMKVLYSILNPKIDIAWLNLFVFVL